MSEYTLCGKIGAPFGLDGAVHFYPYSEQSDHIIDLDFLYLQQGHSFRPLNIDDARIHGNHCVIFFEGYESPEAARELNSLECYIKRSELPELPEGQYYWFELIGMSVYHAEHSYGAVKRVYTHHHDVLVTDQGIQIPYVFGDTILSVDRASKKIIVDYLIEEICHDRDSDE